MFKLLFAISFYLVFGTYCAQEIEDKASVKSQTKFIIEPFYAIPINTFKNAPKKETIRSEVGVYGLCLGINYLDKVGLGLECSFYQAKVTDYIGNLYRPEYPLSSFTNLLTETSIVDEDSLVTFNYNVFRMFPYVDFHPIKADNYDLNLGVGLGMFNMKSDQILLSDGTVFTPISPRTLPISIRFFIGGKFYVTKNMGFILNMGLGGGYFIKTGLVVKLY